MKLEQWEILSKQITDASYILSIIKIEKINRNVKIHRKIRWSVFFIQQNFALATLPFIIWFSQHSYNISISNIDLVSLVCLKRPFVITWHFSLRKTMEIIKVWKIEENRCKCTPVIDIRPYTETCRQNEILLRDFSDIWQRWKTRR